MIKLFICILIALGLGVWLNIQFENDPGYVLITFQGYSIEATLVTVLLSTLILFVLVYGFILLLKAINPLKLLKKDTWLLMFSWGSEKAKTEKGLQLLLLGHWQESYKLLVENASRVQNPTFNYLAASLAAFQRNDRLAWLYCLDQAEKNTGSSQAGIKNLKALLELKSGQAEQSLAILLTLKKEVPNSPFVLSLIKDIYLSLSDWVNLSALMPELEKNKVLDEKARDQILEGIAKHLINGSSATTVKEVWASLDKNIKLRENVIDAYIRKLVQLGNDVDATSVLISYLKQNWSDALVALLGRIKSNDSNRLLLTLEGHLKGRPNNAVLMLTLGRVSLRNQLWGKAKEYFYAALASSKNRNLSAEINAELGRLLEHLGEHEKSVVCYSKAMDLMERTLPDLPMPSKAIKV